MVMAVVTVIAMAMVVVMVIVMAMVMHGNDGDHKLFPAVLWMATDLRSMHKRSYAHKHVLCSSVTRALRIVASVYSK